MYCIGLLIFIGLHSYGPLTFTSKSLPVAISLDNGFICASRTLLQTFLLLAVTGVEVVKKSANAMSPVICNLNSPAITETKCIP
jgi:hypothetical protein